MYTVLGWPGCKNCNLSVSAGSDIKESRGKWKQRRGRGRGGEREQRSGKVEKEEEEEAKGNLACGFGNFITVYCDLLWFLAARYPVPTIVITTSPTGDVLVEGNEGEDWRKCILNNVLSLSAAESMAKTCQLVTIKSAILYTTYYPAHLNVNLQRWLEALHNHSLVFNCVSDQS